MTNKDLARMDTSGDPTDNRTAKIVEPVRPKPETAWELLERVCEAIETHPLCYYQNMWCAVGDDRPEQLLSAPNECQTAFCRAGWIVSLQDGFAKRDEDFRWPERAIQILGFGDDDTRW